MITSIRPAFVAVSAIIADIMTMTAQKINYSIVAVPEEKGIEFIQISNENDYVCLPQVKRSYNKIDWLTNRILAIHPDNSGIAYLSNRDKTTNIYLKDFLECNNRRQLTYRNGVIDFSFSPDGKKLYFSEQLDKGTSIFSTDITQGSGYKEIVTGPNAAYSPLLDNSGTQIFYTRMENSGPSIWSYNLTDRFMTCYMKGFNPYCIPDEKALLITRRSKSSGHSEIWKTNYATGSDECIVSDSEHSFTSPAISPDGQWIVFVGDSRIMLNNSTFYSNTDIYVCRYDGSDMRQLTYHAADDLSPIWSRDGKYIYFISQRGDDKGTANIWRMTFKEH